MNKHKWFIEFDKHLMDDETPSDFFNRLVADKIFPKEHPFALLTDLANVPQSPVHHPEGNVWNHTMLVVDNAAENKHRSKNPQAFMWAALLHDLGKAVTTKRRRGRITAYDHDKEGQTIVQGFLKECGQDENFANRVALLVRWHMQALFVLNNLPFANLKKMVSEVDVNEIALLALCDRLGRGDMSQENVLEEQKNILRFIEKCNKYLSGN